MLINFCQKKASLAAHSHSKDTAQNLVQDNSDTLDRQQKPDHLTSCALMVIHTLFRLATFFQINANIAVAILRSLILTRCFDKWYKVADVDHFLAIIALTIHSNKNRLTNTLLVNK